MNEDLRGVLNIFFVFVFCFLLIVSTFLIINLCVAYKEPIKQFVDFFFGDGLFNYLKGVL